MAAIAQAHRAEIWTRGGEKAKEARRPAFMLRLRSA
jgi:hypothetical protein